MEYLVELPWEVSCSLTEKIAPEEFFILSCILILPRIRSALSQDDYVTSDDTDEDLCLNYSSIERM